MTANQQGVWLLKPGKQLLNGLGVAALVAVVLTVCSPAVSAGADKVAVIPFAMNAQQDLSFLQKGIVDMLSSRIADAGKVEILSRDAVNRVLEQAEKSFSAQGDLDETKARIIGANLAADYVLYGSLTLVGENTSLDAAMVSVTGTSKTVSFFRQSTGLGSVIPQINEFASEINGRVFGRGMEQQSKAETAEDKAPASDPVFRELPAAGEKSSFINLRKQRNAKAFVKIAGLKGTVACLAVGDVDDDGSNEVVTASDREIVILQYNGSRLVEEKTLKVGKGRQIVAIDVGDINANGIAEIFVSCTNSLRNNLDSLVYEFNGSDYRTVSEGQAYYYRVLTSDNGSLRLVGQEQDSSAYSGGFFEMAWKNGRYSQGDRIPMPRNASVMGLSTGDIQGTGETKHVMIDQFGKLTIVGSTGRREWKGSDRVGGSMLYFLLPRTDPDGTLENREYYQTRTLLHDMDADGKPEVICVNNHEMAGEMLSQFRHFSKGDIEVRSWDGLGLTPVYKTGAVAGQIGDFDIADLDGDGSEEMIVSVITEGKGLVWTTPRSAIIMYPLD